MDASESVTRNYVMSSDSRVYGYIMSPNYPDLYPHSGTFQCNFTLPFEDSVLHFENLDFALQDASASGGGCRDFIDIHEVSSDGNIHHVRSPICGVLERGYLDELAGRHIRMIFHSDNTLARRGFWIKFSSNNFR